MKKRVIGGTAYVVLTYLTLYFNFYVFMILMFLLVGIFEFIMLYLKKRELTEFFMIYFIIFLIGIICLNFIDMNLDLGRNYLVILVTAIMLSDTFAYFCGKKFGKTKITNISPNKTYEGLFGGIGITLVIFLLYVVLIDKRYGLTVFGQLNILTDLLIMFLVLNAAFFGDLLESKLKRQYGVKDSGKIVYGHGGILDRIDSLVFSSIIYYMILFIYIASF